ncbi:hypothetical protein FKP32DRAFT_1607554 [Trametes sanguinea]|nr:hypothetical protein FKP32DRAFT_1607554 [Trametes sanguinea]
MLSPNRLSPSHRRRSHSASSPIPRRQPDDVKWRISAKRSRPSSVRSPSYKDLAHSQPAEKWDVDQWRRGKRARRSSNTEDSSDEPIGMASDPVFPVKPTTNFTFASSSTGFGLPCTSAAFQFFPQKKTRKPSSRGRVSRESSPREVDRISSDEARRMRADALGELHRSVVESGEGLVQKMRDWESTRSRPARPERPSPDGHQPRRSWRRLTSYYGTPQVADEVAEAVEDEEDDIFIVGEAASFPTGTTNESCLGAALASPSAKTAPADLSSASPSVPIPASHSEKAIAALALAMANGAVGISDYEALRASEGLASLDETHVGDLWN